MDKRKKLLFFRAAGLLVILLWSLLASFDEVSMAGNEASRFAVIQAVGEQHTVAIECTCFRTVDRAVYKGHVYSDKPLPLSWSLGQLHKFFFRVCRWSYETNYHWLIYLNNLFFGTVVSSLLFLWSFQQLRRVRRGSLELKFLLALGVPFTGWLLAYSGMLNNHTPAALALLGLWIMAGKYAKKPSSALAAGCGVVTGLLGAMDIPAGGCFAAAGAAALALAAPPGKKGSAALLFCAGGAVVAALLLLLNIASYGNWRPVYLLCSTYTPGRGHESILRYAVDTLFWTRGLFSYQPFLLLALAGLYLRRRTIPRWEYALWGGVLGVLLFYLGCTDEYGGSNYGFRYLIVLIPVLYLEAARFCLAKPPKKALPAVAAVLLAWGVVTGYIGSYAPFCVAFEGSRSPAGHFTRTVESSFLGNLLCKSYERDPGGFIPRTLLRYYTPRIGYAYLYYSYLNLKHLDTLEKVVRTAPQNI